MLIDTDKIKIVFDGATDKPNAPRYHLIARFGWDQRDDNNSDLVYFGSIYFLTDKLGRQYIDTESLSKETVKKMICKWIDEAEMI